MMILKKRSARRFSLRALIFALYLITIISLLSIAIHADSILDDGGQAIRRAGETIGDSVHDAGDAVGDAISHMADNAADGRVTDTDGKIGNESRNGNVSVFEDTTPQESVGWLGWAISITIALIVIVLAVVLIPKKKER